MKILHYKNNCCIKYYFLINVLNIFNRLKIINFNSSFLEIFISEYWLKILPDTLKIIVTLNIIFWLRL